jgi:Uma2 family endonuclease
MSVISTPPTAAPVVALPAPAAAALPLYRLSVAQYHAMAQHGILTPEDRVELIHGLLVSRAPMNPPHRVTVRKVRLALEAVLPATWYADPQVPTTLSTSEPLPDVVIARANLSADTTRHPAPADLGLVVEVSDTTLAYDRSTKGSLYAAERIPVYWIVNLVDNHLEVHTDPSGLAAQPDYAKRQVLGPTEVVAVVLDGVEVGRIAVRDLLP